MNPILGWLHFLKPKERKPKKKEFQRKELLNKSSSWRKNKQWMMLNKQNNVLEDQFVNREIRHQQLQQLWQPLLRQCQLRQHRHQQINPSKQQDNKQRCPKPVTQRPRKRKTAKKSQFQIVRTWNPQKIDANFYFFRFNLFTICHGNRQKYFILWFYESCNMRHIFYES